MESWQLLRVWHCEALDSVIGHPDAHVFTRTSYVSTPQFWRKFSTMEMVGRVEQLLVANYRVRNAAMWSPQDPVRMVCIAFDFEWVERDDPPFTPKAVSAPWVLPTQAHDDVIRRACGEIDEKLREPRQGIANRGFENAFHVVEIDAQDAWHIRDDAAILEARHGGSAA